MRGNPGGNPVSGGEIRCQYIILVRKDEATPDYARHRITPERMKRHRITLTEAGIPTGVMIAPVIPGLTEHEMPSILEAAARTVFRTPQEVADFNAVQSELNFLAAQSFNQFPPLPASLRSYGNSATFTFNSDHASESTAKCPGMM